MNDLIKYFLETFFCLMFFYIPFSLLMKKDTNFSLNRIYLIATLVLSYIIPLIEFKSKQMPVLTEYRDFIEGIVIYPSSSISIQSANINIYDLLIYFYLAVCFFLLVRFMVNLFKIRSLIKEGESYHLGSHNLVVIKDKAGTFSFLKSIFIDEETYNSKQVEHIINHELSHIKEMHSIDLILIELLIIFNWFNPILRFYKRSITRCFKNYASRPLH